MTEQEWLASEDLAVMLDWISGRGGDPSLGSIPGDRKPASDRKLRLFACACCRHCQRVLKDQASIELVMVAERYADGKASWADILNRSVDGIIIEAWLAGSSDHFFRTVSWWNTWVETTCVPHDLKFHLLRDIIGNPLTVLWLAQTAYEKRHPESGQLDPDRLGVLADALEDAGCDSKDILWHLRGGVQLYDRVWVQKKQSQPHVRGCWALDLVLGKE